MKIPRQITVRGAHWQVVITRTLKYGENGEELLGLCDPSLRCIYVNKKQSPRQQFITFLHEAMHAIEFEYERKFGHKIIEKIEEPLGEFLRDNCHFF
jgi:Zn-dependent peptidase ImmA (M78 family)